MIDWRQLRHDLNPSAVLFLGTVQVLRVYRGHTLVWSAFTFSSRWKHLAACRGMPAEIFVPEQLDDVPTAAAIVELCSSCPVRLKCESYGRASQSTGWWGGRLLYFGQPVIQTQWRPAPTAVTMTPLRQRKITAQQAEEICTRWAAEAVTQRQLAEEYGLSTQYVNQLIGGKNVRATRGMALLTEEDVAEIRRRYQAGGVFQRELAIEFGVSRDVISRLVGKGIGSRNATKTHCPKGHEYSPENTYVIPSTNRRTCRACRRKG